MSEKRQFFEFSISSGAEKSIVENPPELDAPISPFIANDDTKEEKVMKKKQQARKTAKRKEE